MGPRSSRYATPRELARHRRFVTIGTTLIVATVVAFLLGSPVFVPLHLGVGGLFLVAAALGPWLLGLRVAWLWTWPTAAMCCLLLPHAGVGAHTPGPVGYLELGDALTFLAYVLFAIWLGLLAYSRDARRQKTVFLDVLAGTTAMVLAVWSLIAVPLQGAHRMDELVWVLYPGLASLVLAMAVLLALRMRHLSAPVGWFIAGFALITILELSRAMGLAPAGVEDRWVVAFLTVQLAAYLALAASLGHPVVAGMARLRPAPGPRTTHRGSALVVFTLWPGLASTVVPTLDTADLVFRLVLFSIILVLLFLRTARTMADLGAAEAEASRRATHDALTGLPDRMALRTRLQQRLREDNELGRATAVLFLDCDDFKHVNDTWGHDAGDALLIDVAERLSSVLGEKDTAARLGGDEFVVVASVSGGQEAMALASRVRALFETPLRTLPGRTHAVTPSVGVAVVDAGESATPGGLLRDADVAMYQAKRAGRGRVVMFDDDLARQTRLRASVGDTLQAALEAHQIDVEMQPIMGGEGYRSCVGFEVLARWEDADLGRVPPDVFVPVAEQLNLIGELGDLVLRRACRILADLHASGSDHLSISVNVSPVQLAQPDFVQRVLAEVAAAGLPRGAVWLEISESAVARSSREVEIALRDLRAAGVLICVDDFGTGYASLSGLLRHPVDCVKLDTTLVAGLGDEPVPARQVSAILHLLHSLGIASVIAEGVETATQSEALRALGCPMVQGWFHGPPASPDVVAAALGEAVATR
ncbi:MAG: EAL domain-containing protein [Mobilicoccus sp.]|nr:EAL domain-containing protein [Mobilicoccus sp.]